MDGDISCQDGTLPWALKIGLAKAVGLDLPLLTL